MTGRTVIFLIVVLKKTQKPTVPWKPKEFIQPPWERKRYKSMYSRCFKLNPYYSLHLIQLANCKQSFEVELLRPVSKSRRRNEN